MQPLAKVQMVPTFSDFFRAQYCSNNYIPAVDLSEQGVAPHMMSTGTHANPEMAKTAQRLISTPEVQQILSEPLSYDIKGVIPQNNSVLGQHGFKLLSSKPDLTTGKNVPFYSVLEHDELPGLIIKAGGARTTQEQLMIGPYSDKNEMAFFEPEESLLRIEMAERIRQVAQKAKIEVVVPKKQLVAYANSEGITEPTKKYCVICEKLAILSPDETVEAIKAMDASGQEKIGRQIAKLVKKSGLVDASFHNIRLTKDGKIAIIDTEPAGLMVAKKEGQPTCGASVEKCARIGLYTLLQQTSKAARNPVDMAAVQAEAQKGDFTTLLAAQTNAKTADVGLEVFRKQIESAYTKVATPKLSKWKIALSVLSLGLFPLVNAIIALVKYILANNVGKKLLKVDERFAEQQMEYIAKQGPISASSSTLVQKQQEVMQALMQQPFVKDFQKERTPIARELFSRIADVPFETVIVS